jgi:hypothetical protein
VTDTQPTTPIEIDSDHLPDEYENVLDPEGEDVVLAKDQSPVADELDTDGGED